jgi:hypothetical protein
MVVAPAFGACGNATAVITCAGFAAFAAFVAFAELFTVPAFGDPADFGASPAPVGAEDDAFVPACAVPLSAGGGVAFASDAPRSGTATGMATSDFGNPNAMPP